MLVESSKSLPEQTADAIMKLIIDKKLEAGTKIPNEFEIAKLFNVGRSTVREAVRLLVSRHILIVKRGSGTFVADRTGISDDPLGLSFEDDKMKVALDLIDVRLMLEPEIAALAAIKSTDEEAEAIMRQCKVVEQCYELEANHIFEDVRFHEMIAQSTKNRVVGKIVPIINSSVDVILDITKNLLKDQIIDTHREVANAILLHDPFTAKLAMTMHLTHNRRKLVEMTELENKK